MKKRMIKAWIKKKLGIVSPSYCYRTGYLHEYDELKMKELEEKRKSAKIATTTEIFKNKESAIRRCDELHKQGIQFIAVKDVLKEEYYITIEREVEE